MFSIEYQKGRDNAIVDVLSHVASKLDAEIVRSILDRGTIGIMGRADAHDPVVAQANERIHKQVEEIAVLARATYTHVNLYEWTGWLHNKKIQYSKL